MSKKNKFFTDEDDVLFFGDEVGETVSKKQVIEKYIPSSFEDTEEIAIKLRELNDVIVDVKNLNKADASRMINFLGGVMFALKGDMIKNSKTEFTFKVKK